MGRSFLKNILFILIILVQISCSYYLKYTSPEHARKSSILEKYNDIEDYLDQFDDVELEGIYMDEESGFKMIPPGENVSSTPNVYFEFIHISDAQLRDERAKLYGRFISGMMDTVVNSLQFGKIQEKYDSAVFKCLLKGVNTYAKNAEARKPAFLIHTGDSVHVSILSELWEFLYILDRDLKAVPWFNVIGNHDVTIFGTPAMGKSSRFKNPTLAFLPITDPKKGPYFDPAHYIRFHLCEETVISGIPIRGPVQKGTDLDSFAPGAFEPNYSGCHGFDMTFPRRYKSEETVDRKRSLPLKGYYTFDYRIKKSEGSSSGPEKIRVVVMNTAEYVSHQAQGGISDSQIGWLQDVLKGLPDSHTRVIAFGHHPLLDRANCMRSDDDHARRLQAVQDLFREGVDVYFCGHLHRQGYDTSQGFLQVYAPSILEYPQTGHLVRMEYHENSISISVIPFSHAEMQHESALSQGLDQIAAIWEKDEEVLDAIHTIVEAWKKDPYFGRLDINRILELWNNPRAKKFLDSIIEPYGKKKEIQKSIRKAVLLKHAFLARNAAMKDRHKKNYFWLGDKLRFSLSTK